MFFFHLLKTVILNNRTKSKGMKSNMKCKERQETFWGRTSGQVVFVRGQELFILYIVSRLA